MTCLARLNYRCAIRGRHTWLSESYQRRQGGEESTAKFRVVEKKFTVVEFALRRGKGIERERGKRNWRGGIFRGSHFSVHAYRYFRGNRVPSFPRPGSSSLSGPGNHLLRVHTRLELTLMLTERLLVQRSPAGAAVPLFLIIPVSIVLVCNIDIVCSDISLLQINLIEFERIKSRDKKEYRRSFLFIFSFNLILCLMFQLFVLIKKIINYFV